MGGYAHPREVMICTFSQNAARELRQRFDRAASEIGCRQDLSGVQIGTIHGFCNSILKEGDGAMSAGPDLQTLDSLQQMAFIQSRLEEITSPQQAHKFVCRWGAAGVAKALADSFNTMSERLIDPQMLIASQNALHRALGECYVLTRRRYAATGRWIAAICNGGLWTCSVRRTVPFRWPAM